jgi:hypothetical protein
MNSLTLLVRPRWIEGESWPGFLLRLSNANELPGISWLASWLEAPVAQLLVERPQEVLARLGYTASDAPAVQYPKQRMQALRAGEKGEQRRARLLMQGRRLQSAVCPCCLSGDQTPYVRAVWERPLEVGCTIHQRQLLRQCTSCGKKLLSTRPRLTECSCGASLLTQSVPALGTAWTSLLHPFGLERRTASDETFQPIPYREVVATAALERIALYERQQEPVKRKRRVSAKLDAADLGLALPWFTSWPASFARRYRAALEAGRGEGEDRRTSYIQAKTLFAPMFPRLNKVVRAVAKELNYRPRTCLQLGVQDYLACASQSVASAAKLLGVTYPRALWMAKQGVLAGSTQVSTYEMQIPTEAVLDVMARLSAAEDWRVAAKRRGCKDRAIKQLLRIGLIECIPLGDKGECRVDPDSWDAFVDYIVSVAQPLPGGRTSFFTLDAVIGASQRPTPDPERTARIVQAIACGTLPVYARPSNPDRIDDLLITPEELKMTAPRHV